MTIRIPAITVGSLLLLLLLLRRFFTTPRS